MLSLVRREFLVQVAFWNLSFILFSQISIPLPFSPVPITLQTFILLLCVLYMGKNAYIPVLLYVLEGILGLPVFAGWTGGIAKILGPTGGYILGFIVSSVIAGYIWDILKKNVLNAIIVGILMHIVIYILGVFQLSLFVGVENSVKLGILPFIIGDAFKVVFAALIYGGQKRYTLS